MEVIVQYNDNGSAVTYGKIACELIRCKNCEHWYNHYGKDQFPHKGQCELMELPTDDDFYCKGGERRSE